MIQVTNIQQEFTDHLFSPLNGRYGNAAPGGNWSGQNPDNEKNRYAIIREYRSLSPEQVIELVKGRTHSNLGAVIIGNTRVVYTPIQIMGRKYASRLECLIYLCSMNVRQSQIGGDRVTYQMVRDVTETLINNPFTINRLTIPLILQTAESEFANTDLDAQRLLAIIPISEATTIES